MPNVDVLRDELHERLGREYTEEEFHTICFDFGIELDDVTTEFDKIAKEQDEQTAIEKGASKETIYTIDIPANRHDLLGLEGLCSGLNIFLGNSQPIEYKKTEAQYTLRVTPSTKQIRPYVVACVLRDFNMTERVYERFIELQDKLHFNICRKREYASVGTHDLDKCKGNNFRYDAQSPDDIKFQALKETKVMTAKELFAAYNSRPDKLCSVKKFCPLIQESPVYPVIYDESGEVLSLPPIINSDYSKIDLNTKNIFIEVTATDLTKGTIVLHTIIAAFAEYCENKFVVEPVIIEYEDPVFYDGAMVSQIETPTLKGATFKTSTSYINANLGTTFSNTEVVQLLNKMSLIATAQDNDLEVYCPITRSDILHPVDIVEDVAIAFNYNNLVRRLPEFNSTGLQQPLNKLTDEIRQNVAMCGYTEVLTWALMPKCEAFDFMNLKDQQIHVELQPAKTKDFQMVRANLMPGVLKTLSKNQGHVQLPIQIFECGDCCFLCDESDVGARNERRLCALICSNKSGGFELIHGLLERIMQLNGVPFVCSDELPENYEGDSYGLAEGVCPTFLPNMQASVILNKDSRSDCVGKLGIVHPTVLNAFEIKVPAVVYALELNIECFL